MSVGAAPIIFITNRQGALANVTDATEAQLQQAFSGVKCSGNVFAGGGAGDIQVYLREPLSGTMNTTEYTVFRYPDFSGNSQETGVAGHNPLNGLACGTGSQAWAFRVERYSRFCIRMDRRTQPRICKGM